VTLRPLLDNNVHIDEVVGLLVVQGGSNDKCSQGLVKRVGYRLVSEKLNQASWAIHIKRIEAKKVSFSHGVSPELALNEFFAVNVATKRRVLGLGPVFEPLQLFASPTFFIEWASVLLT